MKKPCAKEKSTRMLGKSTCAKQNFPREDQKMPRGILKNPWKKRESTSRKNDNTW